MCGVSPTWRARCEGYTPVGSPKVDLFYSAYAYILMHECLLSFGN